MKEQKEQFICRYCGRVCKNKSGLSFHENRCKENPQSKLNTDNTVYGDFSCRYCGRKSTSKQGNTCHESYCLHNPNKDPNRHGWNKGLTKETDDRVRKCGETYSKNHKEGKFKTWAQGKSKKTDKRIAEMAKAISNTVKKKVADGIWHNSFSKSRTIEYKGINFLGSWEVNFAKYLDSKNINWERCKEQFDYCFGDENHKYIPDFYLPDFDLYIEIKGCPTEKDFAKWNCFPSDKKLDIYFGDELVDMKIVDLARDVYTKVDPKFRKKHIKI